MSIHVVEFYVIYMKFKKIYTDHVKKIYVIYMVSKPVWILFIHLDGTYFVFIMLGPTGMGRNVLSTII